MACGTWFVLVAFVESRSRDTDLFGRFHRTCSISMYFTSLILRLVRASVRACPSGRPRSRATGPTGPSTLSFLSTSSTPRQPTEIYPQLLASLVVAHRAVRPLKPPRGGAPHPASSHATFVVVPCSIPCCAHSASSRHARSPPLRAVPRPSPRRGATDAAVPHQEVVAAVDAGATATLDLSSQHHEIRSGQTWSGLSPAAPRAPFLPRMLQAYVSSVSYACCNGFMWMLQK
jgi:hypothetical protein